MIHIMKNVSVDSKNNEYILFDPNEKTQTKIINTPEYAEQLKKSFKAKAISPYTAWNWNWFIFVEVDFGEFVPLPF